MISDTLEYFVKMDMEKFKKMGGKIDDIDIYNDRGLEYCTDGQYTLMNRWMLERVLASKPTRHIDFGGQINFLAMLAAITPVETHDIRDPGVHIGGLTFVRDDLTKTRVPSNSVASLSCLHVAEHIGLGRYGDDIDPEGFKKACHQLSRILKPGGTLYFAVPTGVAKVVFNAHRVLGASEVIRSFPNLKLVSLSGVSTGGVYANNVGLSFFDGESYGCGMFEFTKDV